MKVNFMHRITEMHYNFHIFNYEINLFTKKLSAKLIYLIFFRLAEKFSTKLLLHLLGQCI